MKKFIITIVLALVASLSFTVNAQISYAKPVEKDYEFLFDSKIYHDLTSDKYSLILRSSYDIDDSEFLDLGAGKSVAKESLKNLLKMLNEASENERVQVGKYKSYGVMIISNEKYLTYSKSLNVGLNTISNKDIEKIISKL